MASRRRLEERFAFASHAVHHHRLRRRPVLEVLEGRVVLSTFTVNSLGDAGSGSNGSGDLRYCINQANANNQANTIVFNSTVFSTPQTITLSGSQLELKDTGGTQTITGPAAGVTISGGGKSRVFQVDSGVTASISGLTISGGSAGWGGGGGVYNSGTTNLTDCTLNGNYGFLSSGGLENSGTANLTDCTLSGNSTASGWGGLENSGRAYLSDCTVSGNGGGLGNSGTVNLADCTVSDNRGGGLENSGTATLTGCTLSGNSSFSVGGGLVNGGTANLTDCTLSGNTAEGGGGLYDAGTANLIGCTISGNSAGDSGGLSNYSYYWGTAVGTLNLTDTIVAGNNNDYGASDIYGASKVSGSDNLIGTGGSGGLVNGVDGNLVGVANPLLAPLGNYGGPTQTMALLPGSVALDAGGGAASTGTDQRGVPRGHVLDIGAYQATATQLNVAGFPSPTPPGASHSFTVNAVDPFGQPSLDFNVPVTFSSSDPKASLPTGQSIVAGQGSFSATLNTAGTQSITASAGGLSGSQTGITVNVAAGTATFVKSDTTTSGNWIGTYGAQGYDAAGYTADLPSYATVTTSGATYYLQSSSTTDPRAQENPASYPSPDPSASRVAATWYGSSFSVTVDLTDGDAHDVALYCAGLERQHADRDDPGQDDRRDGTEHADDLVVPRGGVPAVDDHRRGGVHDHGLGGPQRRAQRPVLRPHVVIGLGDGDVREVGRDDVGELDRDLRHPGLRRGGLRRRPPLLRHRRHLGATYYLQSSSTTDPRAQENPASYPSPDPSASRVAATWYGSSFSVTVDLTDGNGARRGDVCAGLGRQHADRDDPGQDDRRDGTEHADDLVVPRGGSTCSGRSPARWCSRSRSRRAPTPYSTACSSTRTRRWHRRPCLTASGSGASVERVALDRVGVDRAGVARDGRPWPRPGPRGPGHARPARRPRSRRWTPTVTTLRRRRSTAHPTQSAT